MMESGIEDIFTRGCGLSWCSCDKQSKENATSDTVDVGGSRMVFHLPSVIIFSVFLRRICLN